ncbi:MAG: nitroreductase/quinone reductase family protein [Thermoleophilia bacterium]
MLKILVVAVICVVAAVAAAAAVFVGGLRRGSPTVRRLVRGFARRFINPRMLRTAGLPGVHTSVIHHVGRTSGREYRTPVDAEPTDDGFVIASVYGTSSNWVRNVLAAGSAVLVSDGITHRLDRPEVVPLAEVADRFPPKDLAQPRAVQVERHPPAHHRHPTEVWIDLRTHG